MRSPEPLRLAKAGLAVRHRGPSFVVLGHPPGAAYHVLPPAAVSPAPPRGVTDWTTDAPALPLGMSRAIEPMLVVATLAAAFGAHALNAFNYPRYELDEGTYMSSAWAILNGQITAYPYGYGHPPLGWLQIAGWTQLTGGFFTFGNALNSGRVLMLFYALGTAILTYLLAVRLTGRPALGLLAVALFAFSPLALMYERQVYLDNIGVFWLLLSLYLLIAGRSRLSRLVAAGLAFGLAVLSKEMFVIFLPLIVFGVWRFTSRYHHVFGLITFGYCVLGLIATFVLLAVLRGELLPYEWRLPWDHHPHLSLLDTWTQQVLRGQNEGRFTDSWYTWTHADPLLIGLALGAPLFNLLTKARQPGALLFALLALAYWGFLIRGGVVLSFYVITLLPLAAINCAIAAGTLLEWLRNPSPALTSAAALAVALIIVLVGTTKSEASFTEHPTSAQTQAMAWIRGHVAHDEVIAINSYLYMDLRQPGGTGVGDGASYPYAHVYWNLAFDPELHDQLLQDNWDRIDYLVADSEMLHDIRSVGGPMTLIDDAFKHAILRQEFRANENGQQLVISIYEVQHQVPSTEPAVSAAAPT